MDTNPITLPCSLARAGKYFVAKSKVFNVIKNREIIRNKGLTTLIPVISSFLFLLASRDKSSVCVVLTSPFDVHGITSETRRSVEHGTRVLTALG